MEVVWINHLRDKHTGILITASSAYACHNIVVFGGDSAESPMDYSVFASLYIRIPQLLALTNHDKQVYCRAGRTDDELVNAIFNNIMDINHACNLCMHDYDSFPTLKMVHRHLKNCIVAVEVKNQ